MKALSIKQPWATLVVYGLKTIEVRSWKWRHLSGRILIHAGRVRDEREEVWRHVPPHLVTVAENLLGGIVGAATLVGTIDYPTKERFADDQHRHLNDPDWFKLPLYGFEFADAAPLPFRRLPGQTFFFDVADS